MTLEGRLKKVHQLLTQIVSHYNHIACPCAFPRFRQITSIDCADTGDSFKCYETEILISLVRPYYQQEKTEIKGESNGEIWTCKSCGSRFEYGWSDFSISVDRQYLKLIVLRIKDIGLPAVNPIPLFAGLMGHSYPGKEKISLVDYQKFEDYIKEKPCLKT